MRKVTVVVVALLCLAAACGPSGVSQEEYDQLASKLATAQQGVTNLESKLAAAQQQVADALGCPRTRVSNIELRERRLDVLETYELCRLYGLHLADLEPLLGGEVNAEEKD